VLGLLPPFVLRPLILIALLPAAQQFGFSADATTAMIIAAVASWTATAVQAVCLHWRLKRAVSAGAKQYELKSWFHAALPIFVVGGFYNLLSYVDILVLQLFRSPEEVAHYYAAAKTLALVAFVYFSVAAAVAHRFSEYHAAGDRVRLAEFVAASIRWTFWPSLAALVVMLALGRPFLWLFGPAFVDAYPLMFVMAVGLLARAAIGPGERLLSMLGEQRACAAVYAAAFVINLVLCLILIPRLGGLGAAIATATALIGESALLFVVAKYRLGIHAFIGQGSKRPALAIRANSAAG
jgi:O-antigen/teichoic acid export membrane protein